MQFSVSQAVDLLSLKVPFKDTEKNICFKAISRSQADKQDGQYVNLEQLHH